MPLTRPFSAGRNSPDADQQWAPGQPRNGYDWRGHRGFTHRIWFAWVITSLLGVLPMLLWLRLGASTGHPTLIRLLAPVWLVPVAGWWSHLSGDMIRGRLPIHHPWRKWGRWRWWSTNVGFGDRFEAVEPMLARLFRRLTIGLAVVLIAVWVYSVSLGYLTTGQVP